MAQNFLSDTIHGDGVGLMLGTGGDAFFKHDGSNFNFFNDTGTVSFYQRVDDGQIKFYNDDGSGGTEVYLTIDGNNQFIRFDKHARFNDSDKLQLGIGSDFNLFHDGTNSYIQNYAPFYIQQHSGVFSIEQHTDDGDIIFKSDDGSGGVATYFYLDGSGTRTIFEKLTRHDDNVYAAFGSDSDLRIYHDGSNSYIKQTTGGTGDLIIEQDVADKDIIFKCDDDSGGTETYFFLDGSANGQHPITIFPDHSNLGFGSGPDTYLYHNGTDFYLSSYTGHLKITNYADDKDIIFSSDDGSGGIAEYFRVDGANSSGSSKFTSWPDNSKVSVGTGLDAQFYHSGSHTYIENNTGALNIIQNTNDGNIVFTSDDGAGGTFDYFSVDGGSTTHDGSATTAAYTKWPDKSRIALGTGKDLQLYHDGSNSYINDEGTGNLLFQSGGSTRLSIGGDVHVIGTTDFAIPAARKLYLDGQNNTYLTEISDDRLGLYAGGVLMLDLGENGNSTYMDMHAHTVSIHSSQAGQFPKFQIKNTNADANSPILSLIKDSASPADDDDTGRIYMYGDNDNSEQIESVLIRGQMTDVSDASEDSKLTLYTYGAGSQIPSLVLEGGNAIIKTGVDSGVNHGLQIIRSANSDTGYINYQGGAFRFVATDGDPIKLGHVSNDNRLEINGDGNATFAGDITLKNNATLSSIGNVTIDIDSDNDATDRQFRVTQHGAGNTLFFVNEASSQFSHSLAISGGALSISGDGSNAATLTESSAGILTIAAVDDFRVDAGGDITLDADGNDVRFKNNNITYGYATDESQNYVVGAGVQDKDIIFRGNDNGTLIDALTLDMSEGGNASFLGNVGVGIAPAATFQVKVASDVNFTTSNNSGDLRINAVNDAVDATVPLEFNATNYEFLGTGATTFGGDVIATDGSDTSTLSETGLTLSRSNSYIQSNADNSDTLNIGQSSVRWGHVKVDSATFKVLNGGNERLGIDSSGNATFAGSITVGTGNSSIAGDLYFGVNADIFKNSGDLLLDVAGKIILDSADSGIVHFKNSGTLYGIISQTSSNMQIKSYVNDADMVFKGEDGGSEITALTLDMSNGGSATFLDDIDLGGNINMTGSSKNIVLLYGNELRTKDSGGTQRTVLRAASNKLQYGWSYAGEVEFMGGGSYTSRITINTDGHTSFSSHTKTYSTIGGSDNVRTGIGHYDNTAQAANIGGQLVLGYKYTDAGDYTEGAIIKMYKENGTTGQYGSGLNFQVRSHGEDLSTKMILKPNGQLRTDGDIVTESQSGIYIKSNVTEYHQIFHSTSTNDLVISSAGDDVDFISWLRMRNGNGGTILGEWNNTTGHLGVGGQSNNTYELYVHGATYINSSIAVNGDANIVGHVTGKSLTAHNNRGQNHGGGTDQEFPIGHWNEGEEVFSIDPTWTNDQLQNYFGSSNVEWLEDSTAPSGWAIKITNNVNVGGSYDSGFPYIAIEEDAIYYMECHIRGLDSDTSVNHYMGSIDYKEDFNAPSSGAGNPGSYGYWVMSNATTAGQTWTKATGIIRGFHDTTTGMFETGAKYWTPQALFNYGHGAGTRACVISGWKVVKISKQRMLADGAAATPSLTFAEDKDTGMFRNSANSLSLATGGTQALSIDSSQNITVAGTLSVDNNTAITVDTVSTNYLRINNSGDTLRLAGMGGAWCHVLTTADRFYFDKPLWVDTGNIGSYDEDVQHHRAGTNYARGFANGIFQPHYLGGYDGVEGGSTGRRVIIKGSGDNNITYGPYDDNGWAYFEGVNNSSGLYFNVNQGNFAFDTGDIIPYTDNEISCGGSSNRFTYIYCSQQVRSSGDVVAYYSDERLKDIHGTIPNALEKTLALTGFYYTQNETAKELGYENNEQQVGVSAQEVQKVLPEAVGLAPVDMHYDKETKTTTSKSGKDYLTVKYEKIVPLLIESIKELKAEIDELKKCNKCNDCNCK